MRTGEGQTEPRLKSRRADDVSGPVLSPAVHVGFRLDPRFDRQWRATVDGSIRNVDEVIDPIKDQGRCIVPSGIDTGGVLLGTRRLHTARYPQSAVNLAVMTVAGLVLQNISIPVLEVIEGQGLLIRIEPLRRGEIPLIANSFGEADFVDGAMKVLLAGNGCS